jgi:hypothetical protein
MASGAASNPRVRLLCRLKDPAITESSGIAASRTRSDVFWTHNDSLDEARIFAFDRRGRALATFAVPNADAFDWEDIAAGPGPEQGRSYLYVGDIGDNFRIRDVIQVYRVPEPRVDVRREGVRGKTEPATRFDLRYPNGPHNAEALLIHPESGDLFVITLERSAPGYVFRARAPLRTGAPIPLTRVGSVPLAYVSGGAISPDGRHVVTRAGPKALEYSLPERTPFDRLWSMTPRVVPMPEARSGEAVDYRRDGRALITTTEGAHAPVHEIDLSR